MFNNPNLSVQRSERGTVSEHDLVDGRSVIRVRNIRESAVYHLNFDGDIGRLTGLQLRGHIASMSGIPPEQQILTYNGQPVYNESTGYDIGLRSGSMIILDLVNRRSGSALASGMGSVAGSAIRSSHETAHTVRGSSSEQFAGVNNTSTASRAMPTPPQQAPQPVPQPPFQQQASFQPSGALAVGQQQLGGYGLSTTSASRGRFDAELSREDDIIRQQDALRRYNQEKGTSYPAYGASGLHDDIDVDVEVSEEPVTNWQPVSSADVEESRLMQQDYIWKMEQVRFETERMHREREMNRQRQELEYQAEVLERERIEMERKTHVTKLKLTAMQSAMQEEMSIQARLSAFHGTSGYQSVH